MRDLEVLAAVAEGAALLEAATDAPDVAIVDVRMPPTHTDEGLRAAIEICRGTAGLEVLKTRATNLELRGHGVSLVARTAPGWIA